MASSVFRLICGDFKKQIRHIILFVLLNLIGFATVFVFIGGKDAAQKPFMIEGFMIGFFAVFVTVFILIQRKNFSTCDVTVSSDSVYTEKFGSLYFSEMKGYSVYRQKKIENLILNFQDGRKIAFRAINFRNRQDNEIFESFKQLITSKLQRV